MPEHDEKIAKTLHSLSKGNPGALSVVMALVKMEDPAAFMRLLSLHDLRGAELWILYKDANSEDIGATAQSIIDGSWREKLAACPKPPLKKG